MHEWECGSCIDTLSKHLPLLSRSPLAAGLSNDPLMVARSQFDLFYAHPVSMIPQHLEAIIFCALCLAPNATEENIEHFRVEAGGGRVPEELA